MIAILDYGVGNLFSLRSSLQAIGAEAVITADEAVIRGCDKLILPGVGAFGDAAEKLRQTGLDQVVRREALAGKPLLGICLGMQLLFEKSYEYGEHAGLGLLLGEVVPMAGQLPGALRIPHIGWNALDIRRDCPILKYVQSGDHVYFVHSFFVDGKSPCAAAATEYGTDICAVAARGHIFGCQFHPEKSGSVGLSILRAFLEYEVTA